MKRNNKGFTLIELLTVIAILAIILLIAAPTILGVLDKARKNTFKNQVLLYVEALRTEVALSAIGNSDMNLTLPNEGETKEVDISTIPMDTNPGYTGKIIIKNVGNNKYTYTLIDIASSEYKITGSVLVDELDVEDIYKADEKVEEKEATIDLSGIPSEIEISDSYAVPTSYTGDSVECKIGDTVVTNTSTLELGTHTISCTSENITETKQITVKQPEVSFKILSVNSSSISPTIDGNNLTYGSASGYARIYLNKVGYSFDWNFGGGNGTIWYVSDSGTTTIFSSSTTTLPTSSTSTYTTTETGYITLSYGGSNLSIKNLKYNNNDVIINDDTEGQILELTPNPVYNTNCTMNSGSWSCENEVTENNTTVSDELYIRLGVNYSTPQFKINDADWTFGTAYGPYSYIKLTEPGTYKIKTRYSLNNGKIYSKESEEFIVTIE